jgi:hypothetical protein
MAKAGNFPLSKTKGKNKDQQQQMTPSCAELHKRNKEEKIDKCG